MLIICKKGSYNSRDMQTGLGYIARENVPINLSEGETEYLLKEYPERFITAGIELKVHNNTSTFTDIIVPTYQNEQITIKCFEKIRENTREGSYKIIWVDNNSSIKSRKKVSRILKGINHKKLFLDKNRGFVGGINAGLRFSKTPTICFLNNDVFVTKGWLEKLTSVLLTNNLGIVGPLENPEGISAQSYPYQEKLHNLPKYNGDIEEYNRKLENRFRGIYGTPPEFVAFFCAVLRREVIEVLGFLDEEFGIGLWDDCDYCDAAKYAGFGMGIALDTMIYHKGNATFKLKEIKNSINFDAIHKRNEELYKERKRKRRDDTRGI